MDNRKLGRAWELERHPNQTPPEQKCIRSAHARQRGYVVSWASRAINEAEQRVAPLGSIETRLNLRWGDRPTIVLAMARIATAAIGPELLIEGIVGRRTTGSVCCNRPGRVRSLERRARTVGPTSRKRTQWLRQPTHDGKTESAEEFLQAHTGRRLSRSWP